MARARLVHAAGAAARRKLSLSASAAETEARARGRVPESIWNRQRHKLYLQDGHPLCTLRAHIESFFDERYPSEFHFPRDLDPVVTTEACFDSLLVPAGHASRAESDTFYVDDTHVMRAHMTAHDVALLRDGHQSFISCGDVYRRDTVDRTHYPVFHQIDGVRVFDAGVPPENVVFDLKSSLEGLANSLFGSDTEVRWVGGDFPFTTPSFELEVWWKNEWLEVLGCGQLHKGVLQHAGIDQDDRHAWAFGLGLERLAMILFEIPDIRLFWSQDPRFLEQFTSGNLTTRFKPFSSFPPVHKDISFWDEGGFHENDIHELARDVAGDLVERVECIDTFQKAGRTSQCFRITFRSMERSLTNTEINELYHELRERASRVLNITLR